MDIEELRELALALPHTAEDIKWESNLCFCIPIKMYCIANLNTPEFSASIKVTEEDFDLLTDRDGVTQAPYMAKRKWVMVAGADTLSREEWSDYLGKSYELVKATLTKKLQRELNESLSQPGFNP